MTRAKKVGGRRAEGPLSERVDLAIKSSFDLNNIGWAAGARGPGGLRKAAPRLPRSPPCARSPAFPPSFAAPVRCKASKNLGKTNIASCCSACGVGAAALPLMIDHFFTKISGNEKDRGAVPF